MNDAKRDPRRPIHAEKVVASRALRLSVPVEARPTPVSRKDWLRQRKGQLQAARVAARQRRDQLKAEILLVAQEIAREERVAVRLEAERVKAETRSASVYAKEDTHAAARFEHSEPARSTPKRKTFGTGKRKLISYVNLLRMRGQPASGFAEIHTHINPHDGYTFEGTWDEAPASLACLYSLGSRFLVRNDVGFASNLRKINTKNSVTTPMVKNASRYVGVAMPNLTGKRLTSPPLIDTSKPTVSIYTIEHKLLPLPAS